MIMKKRLKFALAPCALFLAISASSAFSGPLLDAEESDVKSSDPSNLSVFFSTLGYSFEKSEEGALIDKSRYSPLMPNFLSADKVIKELVEYKLPLKWESFNVERGQSLSLIFSKAGIKYSQLIEILNGEGEASDLGKIYEGETIKFGWDDEGIISKIELERGGLESLLVEKTEDGYSGRTIVYEPDIKQRFIEGKIERSLSHTGSKSGLTNKTIMDLSSIFAWDIDFARDIQKGDEFHIVYEELYRNGKKVGVGDVLSAKFVNKGVSHEAVLYTDSEGSSNYFTPDGESLRKAFLRSPVRFSRISSHFNLQRRHPVLHTIRAHKGTDYAASPGTPIIASGDGKVIRASPYGGYGNTVVIQHGGKTTTLYAHMKNFASGIYSGKRVKQGDVIGYVGSTGMVTGPHLHYEFRVNGQPKDPLNVKLANADPISKSDYTNFKLQTQPLMLALDTKSQGRPTSIASLSTKIGD